MGVDGSCTGFEVGRINMEQVPQVVFLEVCIGWVVVNGEGGGVVNVCVRE